MKSAVVTGITGQTGFHIAEELLAQGYRVYGVVRRSTRTDLQQVLTPINTHPNFQVVEADLVDLSSLLRVCHLAKPNLFFNAAAFSHVGQSFQQPIETLYATGLGVVNCLEAIRLSGYHTRFLNCATSELFGGLQSEPCNEQTPFHPRSPYGCAKLYAYSIVVNYRESYRMFACSSIGFNHEGPRRHESFVTRKISKAVARIKVGKQDKLYLGNLDAKRDWGWAPDFARGIVMMLTQSAQPKDYVLATGETHTVREFCEVAFAEVGLDYKDYVSIDPSFYRPAEVDVLLGDYSAIKQDLGWEPTTRFTELVKKMVRHDLALEDSAKVSFTF